MTFRAPAVRRARADRFEQSFRRAVARPRRAQPPRHPLELEAHPEKSLRGFEETLPLPFEPRGVDVCLEELGHDLFAREDVDERDPSDLDEAPADPEARGR